MVDKARFIDVTNRLKTEVADFEKAEEAVEYAKAEFVKIGVSEKKSDEYARKLVLKYWKAARKAKEISAKASQVRRKEVGSHWSVTSEEGAEEFRAGLEALQAMRKGFYNDADWGALSIKEQYKLLDKIEEILKNPGKYRDDDDYETIKVALLTNPKTKDEPIDKIEEAALMALGVLKRRRGSEKQIARMGPDRLGQR